jgi:hypothetical protein
MFFCFCLPDKCCPRFFSFLFVCLIRVVRWFKQKKKKHRTTLIRQTKTKELIIGQHLSGKQKQKKKTSDNTYQANKNKRKKNIGQHLSGKQKQKKKNHRTTRGFFLLFLFA